MIMKLHLEGNLVAKKKKIFEVGTSAPVTPTTPPPSTSAPIPVPTAPVLPPSSPVSSPTPYPTHIAPTPYPTHVAPTMYPTAAADPVPTPYPTDIPPTSYPTKGTCGVKGVPCTKHNQCCGGKCNKKRNTCRK